MHQISMDIRSWKVKEKKEKNPPEKEANTPNGLRVVAVGWGMAVHGAMAVHGVWMFVVYGGSWDMAFFGVWQFVGCGD